MKYKGFSGWEADGLVFWGETEDGEKYRFTVPGLGEWNASSFLQEFNNSAPAVGQIVKFAHCVYTVTQVKEDNNVIAVTVL